MIAKTIQTNTMLQNVNVSQSCIFDDGTTTIIKNNKSLQELNLGWNDIANKGGMKISEAIQVNTTLQQLNLCGNKISQQPSVIVSRIIIHCKNLI